MTKNVWDELQNEIIEADFAVRVAEKKRDHTNHGNGPGAEVEVIEHPGYEPYVKLKCRICWDETYVRRTP